MNIPKNYQFLSSHEWIDQSTTPSPMGISDFAQKELTDIVYVELPETEREVTAGECIAVVESVKSASDIYSPVDGFIREVNLDLESDPGMINRASFGKGWICKIETKGEQKNLLTAQAYSEQVH